MQVIKPIIFLDSQLISTTAVEAYPTYAAGTTYAIDAFVVYLNKVYQSLQASNTGHTPDTSPTFWQYISVGNKLAMFDSEVSTQTTATTTLTTVVAPAVIINSLAYLELQGTQLQVEVRDGAGGTIVYTRTIALDNTIILDWYMYFFEPYNPKTEVILSDVPPYLNARITTTLTGSSGSTVKIGSMIYGTVYKLGTTQYGVSSGIRDYSVKQTDDFGNTTFLQRAFSRRMEANVFMNNTALAFNQRLLTTLRAVPAVWIGSTEDNFSPITVFGYYRDFNIDISYPTFSLCRIEIEGLI
jgi:hypothetical protein